MKTGTVKAGELHRAPEKTKADRKNAAVRAAVFAVGGFVLADGKGSPWGVSLCAAGDPLCAAAALFGMLIRCIAGRGIMSGISELAAGLLTVVYIFIFRGKNNISLRAVSAGCLYFAASAAVLAGSGEGWVLFAAVFFKGVMCGGGAFCIMHTIRTAERGFCDTSAEGGSAEEKAAALGITYILLISALSVKSFWLINFGRAAAGLCTIAAARKSGRSGGALTGVLTAAALLMAEPSLGRSGAVIAFGGMAAGIYRSRGKYAVDTAFILSVFGLTAAAGMPSGTPALVCDMGLAAAVYCFIPERLYLPRLNSIFAEKTEGDIRGDRLQLVSAVMSGITEDARIAAELFERRELEKDDPCDEVRNTVCGSCSQQRCSAACGGMPPEAAAACFLRAMDIAEKTGRITAKELPAGFEGCTGKPRLAEGFTRAAGLQRLRARRAADSRRMLDAAACELEASCGIISDISRQNEHYKSKGLTEALIGILEENCFSVRSAGLFMTDGRPAAEAYIYPDSDFRETHLSQVSDTLSELLGVRLAPPAVMLTEDRKLCRIRWRAEGKYIPDVYISAEAAEGVSGDSFCYFEDGLGRFYIILADGMGRGAAAASRSSLAVNMLRRMISGGTGCISAVKLLNVIMQSVSAEEIFTTVDIFYADLYSGEAGLIKLGASPTAVMSLKEGVRVLDIYTQSSAPIGIIGGISASEEKFTLDENSRLLMTTDGIDISGRNAAAVLENDRLTCRQIAERIMAFSDNSDDDKTAAVFRLYKNSIV